MFLRRPSVLAAVLVVMAVLGAVMLTPRFVPAFGGCEQECLKCHKLTVTDAEAALTQVIPDCKVESVAIAPSKGLWEVVYRSGGKKNIAYLDFSVQYIIGGPILQLKSKQNLTLDRIIEVSKVDFGSISLDGALVMGERNARHKVIVFSDPDCPHCGQLHHEMKQVLQRRRDIAFFIKLFPLPSHRDAKRKAESILCDPSLKRLEDAYAQVPVPDPTCTTDLVEKTILLARQLNITGTPAIIFDDGRLFPGSLQADRIIELVDKK